VKGDVIFTNMTAHLLYYGADHSQNLTNHFSFKDL